MKTEFFSIQVPFKTILTVLLHYLNRYTTQSVERRSRWLNTARIEEETKYIAAGMSPNC